MGAAEQRYSAYKVILKPIVTEKSTMDAQYNNAYAFKVAKDANKVEIRKAVEHIFDVEVASVRTMNMRGKPRRVRYRLGRRPDWKKAVVKLKEGYTIDFI